jgi:hypothetical protein
MVIRWSNRIDCSAGKPQALFAKALAKKSYEKTERQEPVDAVSNEAEPEASAA